jgi:hypothetical protein
VHKSVVPSKLRQRLDEQKKKKLVDNDELFVHTLYRERIVQEDNLINHRMMWMVLSQAFMLALWGSILNQVFNDHLIFKWITLAAVDVMGLIFSAGSFVSIRAAQLEIDELRDSYLKLYPWDFSAEKTPDRDSRKTILPRLTARKHFHRLGHAMPTGMPIMLIFMWVGLFVITVIQALKPAIGIVSVTT